MGVPTSEVSYTSATTGRETTKSIRDMWWHGFLKKIFVIQPSIQWVLVTEDAITGKQRKHLTFLE
jgi:hypothetical protein